MKSNNLLAIFLLSVVITGTFGCKKINPELKDASNPFFQRSYGEPVKPDFPESVLYQDVDEFYREWKKNYLRESNGNTPGGGFYIEAGYTGEPPRGWGKVDAKSQSEAHGYGMLVSVIMDDQETFDGLFNIFLHYPSENNEHLMSWVLPETEDPSLKKTGSATDGDFDIAYALLLAHEKWGSGGTYDYLTKAKAMIDFGIAESLISRWTHRVLMGDWQNPYKVDRTYSGWSTRSSDWMVGHLRAFSAYSEEKKLKFWNHSIEEIYAIIYEITALYSPNTGLMPDFVIGEFPQPAPEKYLEWVTDNDFSWNACRYPWRLGTDYIHNGTLRSAQTLDKIMNWAYQETYGDPAALTSGYTLNGDPIGYGLDGAFLAPMVVASTVSPAYQDFLDKGWVLMKNHRSGYFGDSITLLCMLLITGQWEAPGQHSVWEENEPWANSPVISHNPQEIVYPKTIGNNLLDNGDFSKGVWSNVWKMDDAESDILASVSSNGELVIQVNKPGEVPWSDGMYISVPELEEGKQYLLSFAAWTDIPGGTEASLPVYVESTDSEQSRYQYHGGAYCVPKEERDSFFREITIQNMMEGGCMLAVNFGSLPPGRFYIDDIELFEVESVQNGGSL